MSYPDPLSPYALPAYPAGQGVAVTGRGAAAGSVRGAIAQAAQSTGVDFSYLLGQARLESGLNPAARAGTSSATGLYQFTNATWAQTLARHGAALGVNATALADPASRAQLMGLRNDPQASALMAAAMAGDNQTTLTSALGRPPSSAELYLAHFLGPDGAVKFLSGLASDPAQSAASLFPKPAAANRAVFFDGAGAPRSLGQVMALLSTRLASAMEDGAGQDDAALAGLAPATWGGMAPLLAGPVAPGAPPESTAAAPLAPPGGPLAQEFAAAARSGGQPTGQTGSMADTLRATFGVDAPGGSTTPGFIRSAYGRLQAFGL